ncbi:hypothetical protein SAMN05880501_1135 [Ureibacillus xyleni]|uniref:Uncharacterized protein n=1 Tax=Ureibacillus xyleni TaxID=614648 RepID=A0A285TH64_9BACL|nr:hypothetical protein [Ureibacillus xyleni]SOC21520.1 hypothetical protein SAMN05880501_1135 [Ureibacillus xyleni]
MNELTKNQLIRQVLYDVCFATGYGFLISSVIGWFVPPAFVSFLMILLAASLFVIHTRIDENNQKKEMVMLFVVGTHFILFFSGLMKSTWQSEFVPVQDMVLLTVVLLAMIVFYGIFAYFRAKSNYKKVRGNQKHSAKWRITPKERAEMELDERNVLFSLGFEYEKEGEV